MLRLRLNLKLPISLQKKSYPCQNTRNFQSWKKLKHGVDISIAYQNDMSCNVFVTRITEVLARDLKEKLSNAKFISVVTEGSEDASISEKEAGILERC